MKSNSLKNEILRVWAQEAGLDFEDPHFINKLNNYVLDQWAQEWGPKKIDEEDPEICPCCGQFV